MNWKNLFIKTEDPPPPQKELPKKEVQPVTSSFSMGTSPVPVQSNNNYDQEIDAALKGAKKGGLDFMTFLDSIRKLDGKPLSEPQKFEIAYTTYDSAGCTVDKLIQSANNFLQVLEGVKTQFEQSLAEAKKSGVDDKLAESQKLHDEVEELTKQIQEKSAKAQSLATEASKNTSDLGVEENAFNFAFTNKQKYINDSITNIKNYLNANTTK